MDYTTIQTDPSGRMLCPRCNAPLYARAVEVLSGMPVFLEEDEIGIRIEFNGDDAAHCQCDEAVQYCEQCGWSSDTEPDSPVEDTALRHFIAAVEARFTELRAKRSHTCQPIYGDDEDTVGAAVADVLDGYGYNVEPKEWCAISDLRVQDDEKAHVIPTQDILNWMGDELCQEVLNHFPDIGIRPLRILPVPHGVLCCVRQIEEDE